MPTRFAARAALRRAIAPFALLAAIAVPGPSFAAADAAWFPLQTGAEWFYETHRDLTLSPEKASLERYFYAGQSSWVAEPATDRTPNGVRIRKSSVQSPLGRGGIRTVEVTWDVYSFASELRLHASGGTGENETPADVVYQPPLRILPTTTVGESWDAGTFRQGDRRAALRGKVTGIEDLDGTPAWKGCLKVEFQGDIAGSLMVSGVRTEIESGQYERVVWFARGTGIVRDVTTVTSQVKLPDERRAEIVQVSTERLLEHRPAK